MLINNIMKRMTAACLAGSLMLSGTVVFAAGNAKPSESALQTLTVEQATATAIAVNTDLINSQENVATTAEDLDDLKTNYFDTFDDSARLTIAVQIIQTESRIALNYSNDEVKKEKLTQSVLNYFVSIIAAEKDLELYDQSLELQKKQLDITRVSTSLGRTSQADFDAKKNSYDKSLKERETKQSTIDKAYVSLNNLMKKNTDTRYRLVLNLEYEKLGAVSILGLTDEGITKSPTIGSLRTDVEVAQYKLSRYDSDTSSSSKEALEKSLSQTYRALDDEKARIEQAVKNLYGTIKDQETRYDTACLELANMKKQLAIKEVQLELGKITALDLESYRFEIVKQAESIRSLVDQHEANVKQLKTPYTL